MVSSKPKQSPECIIEQAVHDRLYQAEYGLQLLADRAHPRLEKLLNGITSNYRVVNNKDVLEAFHAGAKGSIEDLKAESYAVGTIRSSFVDGQIEIEVYSIGLNQAELLARSKSDFASIIFEAIGLTSPIAPLEELPAQVLESVKVKK